MIEDGQDDRSVKSNYSNKKKKLPTYVKVGFKIQTNPIYRLRVTFLNDYFQLRS